MNESQTASGTPAEAQSPSFIPVSAVESARRLAVPIIALALILMAVVQIVRLGQPPGQGRVDPKALEDAEGFVRLLEGQLARMPSYEGPDRYGSSYERGRFLLTVFREYDVAAEDMQPDELSTKLETVMGWDPGRDLPRSFSGRACCASFEMDYPSGSFLFVDLFAFPFNDGKTRVQCTIRVTSMAERNEGGFLTRPVSPSKPQGAQ